MTRAYSPAIKRKLMARLTGVNALSAAQLARESGTSQQNLSRWLSEVRNGLFPAAGEEILPAWTVEQKAGIILRAAELTGDELKSYLEGEGIRIAHFRRWRLALQDAGEESVGMQKRIAKLERELARVDRALAKAVTLLLLRETTQSHIQNEDDAIDEQVKEEELNCSI